MEEIIDNKLNIELRRPIESFSPIGLESKSGKGKYDFYVTPVFYVSDVHLEFYVKKDLDVKKQIYKIVDNMIKNTPQLDAILRYRKFDEETEEFRDVSWLLNKVRTDLEMLIKKNKLNKSEQKEFERLTKEERELSDRLDYLIPLREKAEKKILKGISDDMKEFARKYHRFYILIGGDISDSIEYSKIFYGRLRDKIPEDRIMAVLGNHEISTFETLDQAYKAYFQLFVQLCIFPLFNMGATDIKFDERNNDFKSYGIYEWPDNEYFRSDELCFYGGIGFNKFDQEYNAETIITAPDIQGDKGREVAECEKYIEGYKKALEFSKVHNRVLVVLSHYPLHDWMKKNECDSRCYYFYGHDHRNSSYGANGAYVFGDNQIGYKAKEFSFKCVELNELYNPFYSLKDGCHIVNVDDYIQYHVFAGEGHIGGGVCRNIRKYIEKGYSFWMIKKNGYFGFFLTMGSSCYLCKGGTVAKLPPKREGIIYFYSRFEKMINRLVEMLLPYRSFQEKISEEIKSIGGVGSMHGLIVDYDFWHHVEIDPFEKRLVFYYSPMMGFKQEFTDVRGLLSHVCKDEIEVKNRIINVNSDGLIFRNEIDLYDKDDSRLDIQRVDIKNSFYAISSKMKNLERIFTAGILREWDESWIKDVQPEIQPRKLPEITGGNGDS